jgi:hypothetical protein
MGPIQLIQEKIGAHNWRLVDSMKERDSQQNSYENNGELHGAKQRDEGGKQKGKGLDFMALRLDVARKHIQLMVKKKITPTESAFLHFLEIHTIGADNSRKQICSKAQIYLEDIASELEIPKSRVYSILKSLDSKSYIIREKTRSKGLEVLGLNPDVFTQILTDRQHEEERRRNLRLAVDNTKNPEPEPKVEDQKQDQEQEQILNQTGTDSVPIQDTNCTNQDQNVNQTPSQVPEIIDGRPSLYSSRPNYISSRWQNREPKVSLSWGNGNGFGAGRNFEDIPDDEKQAEIQRQLERIARMEANKEI